MPDLTRTKRSRMHVLSTLAAALLCVIAVQARAAKAPTTAGKAHKHAHHKATHVKPQAHRHHHQHAATAQRDDLALKPTAGLSHDELALGASHPALASAPREEPHVAASATTAVSAAPSDSDAHAAPQQIADSGPADPIGLRSGSALVIDEKTNQVLLSKNQGDVRPIASLTKLMTAAVTLDAHLPMDQSIAITSDDVDTLKWSHSRLTPGMVFTREQLLRLALMSSENRAAHALARTYPGGVDAFVQAMNRKAHDLGMSRTHYEDPTGLSPHNESTAHDLALLVKDVQNYATIREFSTNPHDSVEVGRREIQFRNTDHLIYSPGWDILLQKTGYINEAGHCLVLNAVVQGRSVIVVLLDAWGKYSHFGDAERIRNWMQTSGRTMLSRVDSTGESPVRE
jgi:D-alanyl-D-alanine endopeptidase (penicillin-binding protein 7)